MYMIHKMYKEWVSWYVCGQFLWPPNQKPSFSFSKSFNTHIIWDKYIGIKPIFAPLWCWFHSKLEIQCAILSCQSRYFKCDKNCDLRFNLHSNKMQHPMFTKKSYKKNCKNKMILLMLGWTLWPLSTFSSHYI